MNMTGKERLAVSITVSILLLFNQAYAAGEEKTREDKGARPRVKTMEVRIVQETVTRQKTEGGTPAQSRTASQNPEIQSEFAEAKANMGKNVEANFPEMKDERLLEAGLKMPPAGSQVSMEEREKDVLVKMNLPELNREDLKISVKDGLLIVKGRSEVKREEKAGGAKETVYRRERLEGTFEKSAQLPCAVDENSIQVNYQDGVLTVTVLKAVDEKGPKQESPDSSN